MMHARYHEQFTEFNLDLRMHEDAASAMYDGGFVGDRQVELMKRCLALRKKMMADAHDESAELRAKRDEVNRLKDEFRASYDRYQEALDKYKLACIPVYDKIIAAQREEFNNMVREISKSYNPEEIFA